MTKPVIEEPQVEWIQREKEKAQIKIIPTANQAPILIAEIDESLLSSEDED